MTRKSGVYLITCIPTGKQYVGSSCKVHTRVKDHRRDLAKGRHKNRHLQHAYNKYGDAAFRFEVLEICPDTDTARQRELFWYTQLQPAFNGSVPNPGGDGWAQVFDEGYRAKISAAQLGAKNHQYGKRGEACPNYGRQHSEATRRKIGKAVAEYRALHGHSRGMLGKKHSEETRQKMRDAWTPERREAQAQRARNRRRI